MTSRTGYRNAATDTGLLLEQINKLFLRTSGNLFQLQHNLQDYAYSVRRGSFKVPVNYNKAVTSALNHYIFGDQSESARELSALTKVTDRDAQLNQYSRLSVLEVKH